ncbi:MAG: adenylate/guanylate cyclase domain-containing protein [Acidimicrobiia bacterium]
MQPVESPRTRYAKSGELDIAYQVLGSGPLDLLVVPPGFSVMEPSWDWPAFGNFWRGLARFARLILLDKRGTGLSDRVTGVPTLEERMDDVRAVLDAVGSRRAALLGGSEAGPITTLFAATYPERVAALVLVSALVTWSGAPDIEAATTEELERRMLEYLDDGWGSGLSGELLFAPSLASQPTSRALVGRFERMAGNPGAIKRVIAMNKQIDIRSVLATVGVPALVIHRLGDRVAPVTHGRYYAHHIAGAKYVELPGEDHWWWTGDGSATIAEEIEEFLTGTKPAPEPDRVLKTVLFTDIVGSTKLAVELGDHRWRQLLDRHDAAVRDALARFHGQEIKATGDGFLVAFDGPARAIRCAQTITHQAAQLGVEVRAGLHTGECEMRGEDLAGIAVHIGARVAALARGGEVLVTRTVRDLVAGANIAFVDRGTYPLKGVPGDWQILTVTEPVFA